MYAENRGISVADRWAECEQVCNGELEHYWSVIGAVTETLLDGAAATSEMVTDLFDEAQP